MFDSFQAGSMFSHCMLKFKVMNRVKSLYQAIFNFIQTNFKTNMNSYYTYLGLQYTNLESDFFLNKGGTGKDADSAPNEIQHSATEHCAN